MDKKIRWAKIHYTFGLLTGQLFLLVKSINKTIKDFSEFERWLKKIQKEKIKEIRKKIQKEE